MVHRPDQADKLISELGWRDYWQRVYARIGDGVWEDQEPIKTGHSPDSYKDELPTDLKEGRTGLACIDEFSNELRSTGYLHNHARMWLAAYIVHWLKVRWQAGARWFLLHLLDGDPASNNLSWQWVASTFSGKPYIFNRENLARYTDNRFCPRCTSAHKCPFDGDYASLQMKLFGKRFDQ
jgi:deoxyribodipyrimidine photo-lyase